MGKTVEFPKLCANCYVLPFYLLSAMCYVLSAMCCLRSAERWMIRGLADSSAGQVRLERVYQEVLGEGL